jgi:phosphate transport system substrate-binding protein
MKKRDYARGSQKKPGNEQIAAEVGRNLNGVGCVGLTYTKASGAKIMAIDGALPSVQRIHAKTYPYARPTFYTNGDPSGLDKQFLDFAVSAAGQRSPNRSASFPSHREGRRAAASAERFT